MGPRNARLVRAGAGVVSDPFVYQINLKPVNVINDHNFVEA